MNDIPKLRPEILSGTFLVVGSGETYNSSVVVGGHSLIKTWCEYLYGSTENASEADLIDDITALNDEDRWSHSIDTKFNEFEQDLGEVDKIRVFRITD